MNINRDYIVNLFLASSVDRGKVTLKKPIYFYNTDKYTQNIYLVCDVPITGMTFILAFRNTETYKVVGEIVGDATIQFDIPYEYLQIPGRYDAQIVVTTEAERMNSEQFTFKVKNSITRR